MQKREIGQTGVKVNALGYGGMRLSVDGRPSEKNAINLLHKIFDANIDFIDTADAYCLNDEDTGHNEKLIAKALGDNKNIKIATKAGCIRPNGAWMTNGHPKHIREACEKSLKNFAVESLFLYQHHGADDDVPYEDSIGEFKRLQEEGKVQHIGVSNVTAENLEKALDICRIESVQNRFNPYCLRDLANGVMDLCLKNNLTYIAYSPVCGGMGHIKVASDLVLTELAKKLSKNNQNKISAYQIALSWMMTKFDNLIPIMGTSRLESTEDCLKSLSVKLDKSDLEKLDAAFVAKE